MDVLQSEFHGLKTFSTLSSIPGFRDWLDAQLEANDNMLLSESDATALRTAATLPAEEAQPLQVILATSNWIEDEQISAAVEPILMRLCAHYPSQGKGP